MTKNLKLVWVAPSDGGGGAVWVADSCCRAAVSDGFNGQLLTIEQISSATRAQIGYQSFSLDAEAPYSDTPARFLQWVQQHKPDAVFLNNVDTMDCCIPYLPPEVRCIYVVHDTMSFYHRAAVRYESSLDAIIAVSQATADRFRRKLKNPSKLYVVPNGSFFPSLEHTKKDENLVFLGGADPRKGAFDVLKVWPLLLLKNFKGKLHWYGRIPDEFSQRIAKLPASDRIVCHGHVQRSQIFERLSKTAVFLMLSRGEACSIALLESMAMGCLPVAWDIELTGTKEVVPPDFRFLAALGDYESLAQQIIMALNASNVTEGLAEIARSSFSEERMWSRYKEIIEQVVRQSYCPRPQAGKKPPIYHRPRRASNFIPRYLWHRLRPHIGRSAKLYYFLRSQI